MKKLLNHLIALIAVAWLGTGCFGTTFVAQTPVDQPVNYQVFYDNLSPYGSWLNYPEYGHVWSPNAGPDFRPYATNGQWRYSNDGWAWQSNYNWGWAPFHYGRWFYDDNYGWLWMPGYEWSPAWVTWGSVDDNYAWAPLTPEVNIGMQYTSWQPHGVYWNVVPREHIGDRDFSHFIVRNNNYNNITIINNFNTNRSNNYYSRGPEVHEVERFTHNHIEPVAVRDINQGRRPNPQSHEMEVYRPNVQNPHHDNEGRGYPGTTNQNNGNLPRTNQPNVNAVNTPSSGNNPAYNQTNGNNNGGITHDQNTQPRNSAQSTAPTGGNNSSANHQPNQPRSNAPVNQPVPPQNATPGRSTPQQVPDQAGPYPRRFKIVDPAQTNVIRQPQQTPVNQPQQQKRNVQQLPEQRAPQNNKNQGQQGNERRPNFVN